MIDIAFIFPNFKTFSENGTIEDMIANVNSILQFIIDFGDIFNINTNEIALMGNSSGGHMVAQTVCDSLARNNVSLLSHVRFLICIGSIFDVRVHYKYEAGRGTEHLSTMGRAIKGEIHWDSYSPTKMVETFKLQAKMYKKSIIQRLCSISLYFNIFSIFKIFIFNA